MEGQQSDFDPILFKKAFDNSPFGICFIDNRGRYLTTNKSFAKLLGYPSDELVGMSVMNVTHPEDFEMDRDLTEKIFSGAISGFQLDKRFITKKNEVVWAKLYASTYKDLGVGILEPLDTRVDFENKLAKLKKDLDQFVYKTSHDLRAPVANILSVVDHFSREPEKHEEYLKMIKDNALRLDHIIREISDYAVNQKFPVKLDYVNLDNAIKEICDDVMKERRISKSINLNRNVSYHNGIAVDRSRFVIVLKNLIINAINFTDKKGNVDISAEIQDSELILKVKDDGMGIRKDVQAKIYDMFYRGSNLSEGAGLGLFIVREVLDELRGSIEFESSEGEGTEFIVRIPIEKSEPA